MLSKNKDDEIKEIISRNEKIVFEKKVYLKKKTCRQKI